MKVYVTGAPSALMKKSLVNYIQKKSFRQTYQAALDLSNATAAATASNNQREDAVADGGGGNGSSGMDVDSKVGGVGGEDEDKTEKPQTTAKKGRKKSKAAIVKATDWKEIERKATEELETLYKKKKAIFAKIKLKAMQKKGV